MRALLGMICQVLIAKMVHVPLAEDEVSVEAFLAD